MASPVAAGRVLEADWHIAQSGQRVTLVWQPDTSERAPRQPWDGWPLVDIGGRRQPARLFTFAATGPNPPALHIESVTSRAWLSRALPGQSVAPPIPQPLGEAPRPDLARPASDALPAAPVIALRRGRMAGVHLLVVAVTPVFGPPGARQEATGLTFSVRGARLLDGLPIPTAPLLSPDDVTPPDPISARPRLQLTVSDPGMQTVPLSALTAQGLISDDSQLPLLHLTRRGAAVAYEIDGDRLRFYAPPPGDRWNTADIYWLSVGEKPGLRIASRTPISPTADLPLQEWAWEPGSWSSPARYDSTLPGPDGDHWFALDLRAGPELPVITHTLPITARLTPLAANGVFTLHLSGYTAGQHRLQVRPAGFAPVALAWEGSGGRSLSFPVDSRGTSLALVTVEGAAPDGVMIDSMEWLRPVRLGFGFTGALFESGPQAVRLRLQQVAAIARLYDITDPRRPVRVELPPLVVGDLFLDSPAHRRYLLEADSTRLLFPLVAGGSTPDTGFLSETWNLNVVRTLAPSPALALHPPLDFSPLLGADVLYVAPAHLHPALKPLLDHRTSQGYRVALIDVAHIYAGWSGDAVDPAAIRDFVRWLTAHSPRPPQALILVGDGTSDPRNYLGLNRKNLIPPYLLPVDPWLKETACDSCFGQVDGASPLDDPLPDIPVGRIPANDPEQVRFYVEKLLAYERTPAPLDQRSRMIFVADNYREASGQVDGAGDFALSSDAAVAQQPKNARIERVYYDPSPTHTQAPWREPDAVTAWRKTREALSRGGGFAVYTGHAHPEQWASTDLNANPPYLLGLYDADSLTNVGNLPVLLEMTCLTGMFQQPVFSGITIDERLLLYTKGGAAAIWSSTGLGVAYGHDALQRGFFSHYWSLSTPDKRLGALTQAGYLSLFTDGLCCQESLRTFLLLGDPLTRPQAAVEWNYWLPRVGR